MKYNDNGEYKDIYIKTFDTLPLGAEVDYIGSVVPDGWTQVDSYSTSEVDTGQTWIDGKPLYRKTISVDSPTMPLNVNHNVSNIGYLKLDAYFTQGNITAPIFYSTSTDFFRVFRNDAVLSARCGTGNAPTNITFIMEYTKTTD